MPYFSIETNQPIDREARQQLLKKTSTFIADLLGKSESYVMISIQPDAPLIFGGSDEPAAFVRLKSIGLPTDRCPELSEKICHHIQEELGVPQDRVFIDFKDLEKSMFGWNGKTF
jgi:phenylpyruvate tautomerase PptA (4-oxalocrotonate tautomerase family)